MKIEKINDNQIRCTLTSQDLESRKLRLSELAYGTAKAKGLFRDMMEQANYEFGFEAENMPIMIEAIPISPDSIILIITKVADPEELDTRFSKFSADTEEASSPSDNENQYQGADDILDLYNRINKEPHASSPENSAPTTPTDETPTYPSSPDEDPDFLGELPFTPEDLNNHEEDDTTTPSPSFSSRASGLPTSIIRMYEFNDLDSVIQVSYVLGMLLTGENSLYKETMSDTYCLVIHQGKDTPEDFNKFCNILSEYGKGKNFSTASEAYLKEHSDIIISKNALGSLLQLRS